MRRILALDGGGIRGVIPSQILAKFEIEFHEPCWRMFDLIAGTSTGGILACALGLGLPAKGLANLYMTQGSKIFKRHWWRPRYLLPRYSDQGLNEILHKTFEWRNLDCSLTKLMIPAFDQSAGKPYHFKSWMDHETTMAEAARATAAAPSYFGPAQGRWADGGVFANDPAMNAYAEACSLWPGEPFAMLSIGTGYSNEPVHYPSYGGAVQWAKPILGLLLGSAASDVDYMARACLGERYLRIQGPLPEYSSRMDDVSRENLHALKIFSEELWNQHQAQLEHWMNLTRG